MVEFIKGCNNYDCPDEYNFYCDECGKECASSEIWKADRFYHVCKKCFMEFLFETYSGEYEKLSDMDEMDLREEMER